MKYRNYATAGIVFILLALLIWRFWPGTQNHIASTMNAAQATPIQSGSNATAPISSPRTFVVQATPPSWVDKRVAMTDIWAGANGRPQDFYGKAVDQHGNPVEDATAMGTLMQIQGIDTATKKETLTAKTDANGDFEFIGHHGWQLGVVVAKEGYEVGRGNGVYEAPNRDDITNPTQRAVFHMWKPEGSEPMTLARISSYLPLNGSSISFNLLTGAKTVSGGDMTVTYKRSALNASGGKPFDWSITFKISEGGMIEQSDAYPNEAPAEGYAPSINIDMSSTTPQWSPSLSRYFYFKCRGGQDYGRISVRVTLGGGPQPHPAILNALVYTNPNGSRDLEYDPNLPAEAK